MIQVLFVCLGNFCRSPVAEGVFKELVAKKGLSNVIHCDSAGTEAYLTGILPDKRMQKIAFKNGITLTHQSRQLTNEDFERFDYIMALDETNFARVREESFKAKGFYLPDQQLYLYRLFDPLRGKSIGVPDPSYGEIKGFADTYEILERSGTKFLDYLIEKHNLQPVPGD